MEKNILINEKGVALIIVLLMLLILTLIGISAISTTTFETNISGNERVGTNAFYAADAGVQMGLNQLPNTNLIPVKTIGTDSYCWSGSLTDKGSPKELTNYGLYFRSGFASGWGFNRYQVNATGESFGAMKEVELQATWGPFNMGTVYNN
jgi:Na+-transporting methylmalonyl-CoA/oxaloacetate decarboxylase gamma subunit